MKRAAKKLLKLYETYGDDMTIAADDNDCLIADRLMVTHEVLLELAIIGAIKIAKEQ